jgi:hypothetical protein
MNLPCPLIHPLDSRYSRSCFSLVDHLLILLSFPHLRPIFMSVRRRKGLFKIIILNMWHRTYMSRQIPLNFSQTLYFLKQSFFPNLVLIHVFLNFLINILLRIFILLFIEAPEINVIKLILKLRNNLSTMNQKRLLDDTNVSFLYLFSHVSRHFGVQQRQKVFITNSVCFHVVNSLIEKLASSLF